ncbi:MAG TPA: hypothetical protein VFA33_21370 [Bryobacteraceae bacterium]|nr:hypothetical protein [Bryobacteraceae bacterium]
MVRILILGLSCLAAAGAQSDISRDGSFWVRSMSGASAVAPATRLRVVASGGVRVCGAAQDQLTYTWKVRVKGRGETEARNKLNAAVIRVTRASDLVSLVARPGAGIGALDVRVPKTVKEAAIYTSDGNLEACDFDGSVRAQTGGGVVKADRIRGDLRADTGGGDVELGSIEGQVRVVTGGGRITAVSLGGEANLATGGGDIGVQQAGATLHVSTGGGGIRIGRAGGPVIANTGGGPIEISQALGTVTTRNVGGPVQVGAARGVSCENAAGGVKLQNVSGSLRVSTAFGSILAQLLAGQPITDSFLTTANGDITVVIPSNLAVTIQARNQSADSMRRIVSEFPGVSVRMDGGQVVAEGVINGGGPVLRIAGTGGTIFIKRQQ